MHAFRAAQELLEEAVASRLIPGVVGLCGRGPEVLFQFHEGFAQIDPSQRRMQEDTLFDLASLTKVLATLPALLILVQHGDLSLDTPLAQYFYPFRFGAKQKVQVRHLLTHTSGLVPRTPPLWQRCQGSEAIIAAATEEPLEAEPGTQVIYSDAGYIILGALIEQVSGSPLDEFTQRHVFRPLGMHHTTFTPQNTTNIAATEVESAITKVGVVHDKTAEVMGGVAGHAGLFAPADDVARYLGMWVGEPGPLAQDACHQAVLLKTLGLNGNRGWGWVLRGDSQDIGGDLWPESSASHTGFTGTSVIFDRPSGAWAVLLTNRIHFGRQTNISFLRRQFHNAVAEGLFPPSHPVEFRAHRA